MAVSKVDAANQIENQLPQANVANNVNFRNIIINGDMSIAQRSTSESSVTTSGYKTCDRWQNTGIFGTWTISQSTDVPSGQGFSSSFKMDCTTANASPSAGNQLHISQRIEGQNLQYLKKGTSSAESLTLSFWVKTNKTGTYQVNLRDKDNTRIIGQTYTVSSADTWEKKTITFAGDTTGTFGNDNGNSLECEWFLGAGSTYTGGAVPTSWEAESAGDRAAGLTVNLADSTDNEWYITGVQLEAGTTASDFEFLPTDVNRLRCQRYYYEACDSGNTQENIGNGSYVASSSFVMTLHFPTTMRTAPSLVVGSGTNYFSIERWKTSFGYDAINGFLSARPSRNNILIYNNTEADGTAGYGGNAFKNNASASLAVNAEL